VAAAIVLLASVVVLWKRRRSSATPGKQESFGRSLLEHALPMILRMLFIVHPLVTTKSFEAFPCYTFDADNVSEGGGEDGGDSVRYLKADVSIECGHTDAHHEVKNLAVGAIILYPIGLLVLNAALLYHARKAIVMKRPSVLSQAIGFLHREYEIDFFWWELVEMLHRFLLVGLMVVVRNGTMLQLVIGTLISAVFTVMQVQAAPYIEITNDYLASVTAFSLLVVFLCSSYYKYGAHFELPDVADRLSEEQKATYIIDDNVLSAVVLIAIFGSLVASSIITFVQLLARRARLRREARASKARRLRCVDNDKEASAPAIHEGCFHLFLSHVWGTGQDQMRGACSFQPAAHAFRVESSFTELHSNRSACLPTLSSQSSSNECLR
jgi:hypothetical protein